MEIAINTDFFIAEGNAEPYLKYIAEAGFSHIHWCHDWCGDYLYSEFEIEQIGVWLKKYNLQLNDLHATDGRRKSYKSFNEYERLAGVELIKNRVDLAAKYSGGVIVLHMSIPDEYAFNSNGIEKIEEWYLQVYKSLDELQPYCKNKGIKIAVENMRRTPYELQVEQFKRLFERYSDDFIGLCFDSGHANCTFTQNGESMEFLDMFKERLISVHLNDNDGLGNDQHLLPFEGTIDWEKLIEIIAKSPYNKCFTMEVAMKSSEIKDKGFFLKEAYKRGIKGAEIVESFRRKEDLSWEKGKAGVGFWK